MKIVKNEPGKLPYGSYTKKDRSLSIVVGVVLGLFLGGMFIFLRHLTNEFLLSLLIVIVIAVVIIYIIALKGNQLNNAIKKYIKTLDIIELEHTFQTYLKENLHSESRNLLLMQYANILLDYNQERAFILWQNVKEPLVDKFVYHLYQINFLIAEKKFDEAKSLIELFRLRYPSKKFDFIYERTKLSLTIKGTTEIIDDLESKFQYNDKIKIQRLNAYFHFMIYYHTRGDIEFSKKYALLIKEENANITVIDDYVKKVLDIE